MKRNGWRVWSYAGTLYRERGYEQFDYLTQGKWWEGSPRMRDIVHKMGVEQ